ncbi:LysR substrate-binding domain-containing protein [Chelonobacter oris]|nr:LysR substrate-binding domain-containing protein [Chelonobacter oris]
MSNIKKVAIPPIKSIQAFEQAAQLGSIVKAAESLSITPSAVSHQIAGLESFLNKKLFYRTGRGMILTGTGEKYLDAISGALHTINAATSNIIEKQEKEILSIHTSPSFGLLYLLPRIEKFKKQYNELQINLTCSYENIQFNLDQVDIDIRHGHFSWKNLSVLPIKNEYVTVLAHPSFLAKNKIKSPEDLLKNNLILSQSALIQWPQWFAHHNINISQGLTYAFSFDRSYMSCEAAKQGLGLIIESNLLTNSYLKSGDLIPVFDETFNIPINAHYITFPHSHKKYTKVQYFIDWLNTELNAQQ